MYTKVSSVIIFLALISSNLSFAQNRSIPIDASSQSGLPIPADASVPAGVSIPAAPDSNITDKLSASEESSHRSLCDNLKDQMLAQPNHVHAQIRIDTAYSKNCEKIDPIFWQSYWSTSMQSDVNKKAQMCNSLLPTDPVYIKYRCSIQQNTTLDVKEIQICERLESQLQSEPDKHTNSRINYAKNLKCHLIDQKFWAKYYTP